jgi:hypothetical protein
MSMPTTKKLIYVMIFWLVVDFAVPLALGIAHAPWWTPVAWAFTRGVYIGHVHGLSNTFVAPHGKRMFVGTLDTIGVPYWAHVIVAAVIGGIRTVLSSNTFWFYAYFAGGYYLRQWL